MIDKDEVIVSVYGPATKNEVPACARASGASISPGDPGKGADAVIAATTARANIGLDPRMRDQR